MSKEIMMMRRHKANSIVGLIIKQFSIKPEWELEELKDEVSRYILPEQAFRAADPRLGPKFSMDQKVHSGKRTLMSSSFKHMRQSGLIEIKDGKLHRTVKMINSAPELFLDLIQDAKLKELAMILARKMDNDNAKDITSYRKAIREIYKFEGLLPKEDA